VLEKRLANGHPLEEAAAHAGIPLSECYLYIKKKIEEQTTLDFELKRAGQNALKIALTKLTKLANGSVREGVDFESTDLIAARELARTAIAVLRLSKQEPRGKEKLEAEQGELNFGPWDLKEIE